MVQDLREIEKQVTIKTVGVACGIIVSVAGNCHCEPSSNPG